MSSELSLLAIYGLLIAATVVLNVLTAMGQVGLMRLGGPRDKMPALTGVAGRVARTLDNSVTAMAMFAPAILILAARDAFTGTTLLAAQVFLLARLAYLPIYALAPPVPFLRTTVWSIGFVATIILYVAAL